MELISLEQGSQEWHDLRKKSIGASDAPVIMGVSPWRTPLQLYKQKVEDAEQQEQTPWMKQGLELEPMIRNDFAIEHKISVQPAVVMSSRFTWAIASLDGISEDGGTIVEIKCPGYIDHAKAEQGKIPEKYWPQLQHQLMVTELDSMWYASFRLFQVVYIKVERDDKYIKRMVEEELKFLECMETKTPPQTCEKDFTVRTDEEWKKKTSRYIIVKNELSKLEKEEESLRQNLILMSADTNSVGYGLKLSKQNRRGSIEYEKIEELKSLDLEKYRKPSSTFWRITI